MKNSIFGDLLPLISEEHQGAVVSAINNLLIVEANTTRGAKNPYSGSYESQESSINFNIRSISGHMEKVDIALVSYATQWAFLLQCLISGEIKKEKYIEKKKQLLETSSTIVEVLLK